VVTTSADDGPGSLREIISVVNDGDTITFAPNITGTEIVVEKNITILGENKITINADGPRRIFYCDGINLTLDNLVISGAVHNVDGGAILFMNGILVAKNCEFANNRSNYGAAL
jgi:hypothetical protein